MAATHFEGRKLVVNMSAGAGRVGNSGVMCKCVLIQASFDVCSLPPIYTLVIRDALPRSVFIQLFDGNANARACHVAAFAGWRGSGEMLAVSKNVVVNVVIMKPICSSSDEGWMVKHAVRHPKQNISGFLGCSICHVL